MAVTSIAELKTKIQTLSGNKRENLRNSIYLSTIATELQTEIVDLEALTVWEVPIPYIPIIIITPIRPKLSIITR